MSKVLWLGLLAAAVCLPGGGQTPKVRRTPVASPIVSAPATVSGEAQAELAGMAARAGVIFAGRVLEIAPNQGYVDVTFRVDEAVRGCKKQGTYVLREWAGLWDGQPARYRVGQRLLMLLTARGAAGMSAPVGGDDGIIPIAAGAVEPLADAKGVAPAEDGSVAGGVISMTADLRWVMARARRPVVSEDLQSAVLEGDGAARRWGHVTPLAAGAGSDAAQLPIGAVLALLRAAAGGAADPVGIEEPGGPVVHPIASPGAGAGAVLAIGLGSGHEER